MKHATHLLDSDSFACFSDCCRKHDAKGTRAYNLKSDVSDGANTVTEIEAFVTFSLMRAIGASPCPAPPAAALALPLIAERNKGEDLVV